MNSLVAILTYLNMSIAGQIGTGWIGYIWCSLLELNLPEGLHSSRFRWGSGHRRCKLCSRRTSTHAAQSRPLALSHRPCTKQMVNIKKGQTNEQGCYLQDGWTLWPHPQQDTSASAWWKRFSQEASFQITEITLIYVMIFKQAP